MPGSNDPEVEALIGQIQRGCYADALPACRRLAAAGSSTAQVLLGWMHQAGKGVPQSFEDAELLYREAVKTGSPEAQFYLGTLYRAKGQSREARDCFEAAAVSGYPPALYHLGRAYRFGENVAVDNSKALQYIKAAADRGHLFARRDIAREMIRGTFGYRRIPTGIISLLAVFWSGIRMGPNQTHNEMTLRL